MVSAYMNFLLRVRSSSTGTVTLLLSSSVSIALISSFSFVIQCQYVSLTVDNLRTILQLSYQLSYDYRFHTLIVKVGTLPSSIYSIKSDMTFAIVMFLSSTRFLPSSDFLCRKNGQLRLVVLLQTV